MFEFAKQILTKVSFDSTLFEKELSKAIRYVQATERPLLQAWCLVTFVQYHDVILQIFKETSF